MPNNLRSATRRWQKVWRLSLKALVPAFVLVGLMGCGASLPSRYVIERDVDGLRYRRYQKVLDVEFPVPDNPSISHTAVYFTPAEPRPGIYPAAVTVYKKPASLTAEVRERLDKLHSYELETRELEGEWVWALDGGDHRWAMWVSGRHLVKLGYPAGRDQPPEALLEAYLDTYPSDLGSYGRARSGTASAGISAAAREEEQELRMPLHLREGTAR